MAAARTKMTHNGRSSPADDEAAGEQRQEDHAHRLLGVLEAVAERHGRGRDGLGEPEAPGPLCGLARRKAHMIASISRKPSAERDHRRERPSG